MPGENHTLNILVVEDNPGDIFLFKEFLRATDLDMGTLFEAASLAEAKTILATENVDLVFLDLSLPDGFGLDSYTSLSSFTQRLPVILLTGLSDTNTALQALLMGAQDYLMKGDFDEKLLSRAIRYSVERKRNQENLRESEERYRELFNSNPIPMWVLDVDSLRFMEANAAAVQHYGYSHEEFLELTLADIRLRGNAESLQQEMREMLELANGSVHRGLRQHLKKNGQVIFVEIAWHSIEYKEKPAMLALANDVTERIRLEQELNEQRMSRQRQITEAVIVAQEKERTEIGKELHDNVNQILGASNLYINTAMTDEDMRQELLERSTELVSNAINEIRKISKSLITPGLREIGLLESIEDITDDMKLGAGFVIHLDFSVVEEDIDDRRKLTLFRIVQEQLNNIVKHAKATEVMIRITVENGEIVLTVIDNGIGFDISRHRKGVGITNIISRVELFNGKVDIRSRPGEGCELYVRLPAK